MRFPEFFAGNIHNPRAAPNVKQPLAPIRHRV
jgi:hypothetical protein